MTEPRVTSIEWAPLEGRRPRPAGANARLGDHGSVARVPIARLRTDDGAAGFGIARLTRDEAAGFLGGALADAFDPAHGATAPWRPLEYPLWDLAGRRAGQPVYALAAATRGRARASLPNPLRVPCYDTTLLIDDLHLASQAAAAHLIADEARQGYDRGHRAFKIKVGRGAKHLPLEEGTRRDIAVVRAVRAAVGPSAALMLDANNGFTLNLAKRVLAETADCGIMWLEEAFHEDAVLYRDLRQWQDKEGLSVLIADGEGQAAPQLLEWAQEGVVDVVQYDYLSHGFTRWIATGLVLDACGARSAPHHYGTWFGNYAAGHLAPAIDGFLRVEWEEATVPAVAAPGYEVREGRVTIPDRPGFGLELDEAAFARAVATGGFALTA